MQTTKKEEKLSLSCSRVNVNATRFVVHPCFSVIIVLYVYLYTRECPSYENKRDDCRVKISLSTATAIMSRRKKEKEKKNDEIYGRPCWAFVSFKEKTTTVGRCWTPKEIRLKRKLSGLFISLCSQESFTSSSLFVPGGKNGIMTIPPNQNLWKHGKYSPISVCILFLSIGENKKAKNCYPEINHTDITRSTGCLCSHTESHSMVVLAVYMTSLKCHLHYYRPLTKYPGQPSLNKG